MALPSTQKSYSNKRKDVVLKYNLLPTIQIVLKVLSQKYKKYTDNNQPKHNVAGWVTGGQHSYCGIQILRYSLRSQKPVRSTCRVVSYLSYSTGSTVCHESLPRCAATTTTTRNLLISEWKSNKTKKKGNVHKKRKKPRNVCSFLFEFAKTATEQ